MCRTQAGEPITSQCRPAMFSVPCVFIHSKSPGRLLPVLSCVYLALYSPNACVCGCLCVCVHAHLEWSLGTRFCALKILFNYLLLLLVVVVVLTHCMPVVSGPQRDAGKRRAQKHCGVQRALPVSTRVEKAGAPHLE